MSKNIPILCCSFAGKMSPLGMVIHNAAYKKAKINSIYIPFAIDNIQNATLSMKTLNIRGAGVSMPFKQTVMQYLDDIDLSAKQIGAVNTLVNNNGKIIGYNTDYIGAINSLKEQTLLKGKKVLMLGAGGVARAILYGLQQENAKITIYNRTTKKAQQLAEEFDCHFVENIPNNLLGYDILINATSVGFNNPKETPILKDVLHSDLLVLDVVFMPIKSKLIQEANLIGCNTIQGSTMLLYQAAYQIELYHNIRPDLKVMEEAMIKMVSS